MLQQAKADTPQYLQDVAPNQALTQMQGMYPDMPGPFMGANIGGGGFGALGAGLGGLAGYLGSDEEDKMRNALLLGLLGGGAGYFGSNMYNNYQRDNAMPEFLQRYNADIDQRLATPPQRFPGEAEFEPVQRRDLGTAYNLEGKAQYPWGGKPVQAPNTPPTTPTTPTTPTSNAYNEQGQPQYPWDNAPNVTAPKTIPSEFGAEFRTA